MKRQIIAFLCCIVLVAGLFSGCSKKETESNNNKVTAKVTLAEYKGLRVGESKVEVSEKELQDNIDACLEAYADRITYEEGTVQEGDTVYISYVGTIEEGVFQGGTAENVSLTIGSNAYIDGFEDGLVGAAIGDTVTLNLNFGEVYKGRTTTVEGSDEEIDLENKDVTFKVTIHSLTRSKLPEYNDEFVKEYYSGYDLSTVDEFEAYLERMIRNSYILGEVWEDFMDECKVTDYDQKEVEDLIQQIVDYYSEAYKKQGVSMDDYLSAVGTTMDEYKETFVRPAAEATIKEKQVVKKIAENEKIEVTDEIYDRESKLYMVSEGFDSVAELEEYYTKEEIEFSILYDLVTQWVADNAEVYDDSDEVASDKNKQDVSDKKDDQSDDSNKEGTSGEKNSEE